MYKSSVIKCTPDNCILKKLLKTEMLQQKEALANEEYYQISCIHENELVAIGLVQMTSETEAIVNEIIVTYMHLVGITLQRINAVSALKNNQLKLEELNRQLKAQQALLVQQEQLASIGQLAAGVAHEINNPVGFVMSNLGTLTEYVEIIRNLIVKYSSLHSSVQKGNKQKQASYCKQIDKIYKDEDIEFIIEDMEQALLESKEGTKRVQTIVQNLKSFARLDPGMMKAENVNDGIEASLKLVWNELKYKCTVNKNLENIPLIKCSLGELNQVFMNLLLNAGQSIKDKGTINISSKHSGNKIEIAISDTGTGIPKETISHIFEPFYTTKGVGKGTGLGLSISHGIIKKHNGEINVDSEIGKGSTFTIILPCSVNENENDK